MTQNESQCPLSIIQEQEDGFVRLNPPGSYYYFSKPPHAQRQKAAAIYCTISFDYIQQSLCILVM